MDRPHAARRVAISLANSLRMEELHGAGLPGNKSTQCFVAGHGESATSNVASNARSVASTKYKLIDGATAGHGEAQKIWTVNALGKRFVAHMKAEPNMTDDQIHEVLKPPAPPKPDPAPPVVVAAPVAPPPPAPLVPPKIDHQNEIAGLREIIDALEKERPAEIDQIATLRQIVTDAERAISALEEKETARTRQIASLESAIVALGGTDERR